MRFLGDKRAFSVNKCALKCTFQNQMRWQVRLRGNCIARLPKTTNYSHPSALPSALANAHTLASFSVIYSEMNPVATNSDARRNDTGGAPRHFRWLVFVSKGNCELRTSIR